MICSRETSLEQLSLAEFCSEQARPNVYENGHKNILGFFFDLLSKLKNWAHIKEIKYIKIKVIKI